MVLKEVPAVQVLQVSVDHKEVLALLDLKDHLERQVHKEVLDQEEVQVWLDLEDCREVLVLKDSLDHKVL